MRSLRWLSAWLIGAFQEQTGARWVNDLSVILSLAQTVGLLRVTRGEERVHVSDEIGYGEDCAGRRGTYSEIAIVFCR